MLTSTNESLNRSIDSAVKHYGSLFTLPSFRRVILLYLALCTLGISVSVVLVSFSLAGLLIGILVGFVAFCVGFMFDYLSTKLMLKGDAIYDVRRVSTLAVFCWMLWFVFMLVGACSGSIYGLSWWVKLSLLGFSAVLIMRLIVFKASSTVSSNRIFLASFLQPTVSLLPIAAYWSILGYSVRAVPLYVLYSYAVAVFGAYSFLYFLDRVGAKMFSVRSISLLRAFLVNWVAGFNAPFESILERLGEEKTVEISLVRFDSSKPNAIVAVPSIHPGPFKNIGSSQLPWLLKNALEKQYGCAACVPLGLQGHELDLASQTQNQKVICQVAEALNFKGDMSLATSMVTGTSGSARASCQIFGDSAFVSFTLAPNTTEDLPQELAVFAKQESKKHGLNSCVVINAHNCINGDVPMPEALKDLEEAAAGCIARAVSEKRTGFRLGIACFHPGEFGLKEGMGEGGITALVVETGSQKAAYVVIDGNNMVPGLREKVLEKLYDLGIDCGEVFTTDTHSVSAVIPGRRGYRPIGEVIDHDKLIDYVKKVTADALADLSPSKAGFREVFVTNVKVIGEEHLEELSLLTDRVLKRLREIVVPVFGFCGLVLMLFLLVV